MIKKTCPSLYLSQQIRACEQTAIHNAISEKELMHRAATATFQAIKTKFPNAKKLLIYTGGGNNAGDGYVLALLAWQANYNVLINQYKLPQELPPVAQLAAQEALDAGIPSRYMEDTSDYEADLIIDALIGIGLQGEVRENIAQAINQINESDLPIVAIDIPSGLNADTGQAAHYCVKADLTVTFIAHKLGQFTLDGPDYCGEIICDNLGMETYLTKIQPAAQFINQSHLDSALCRRQHNCHKGSFGHVVIIGGNHNMPGSVILAAKAAFRTGAGVVSVATRPKHTELVVTSLPEAMVHSIDDPIEVTTVLAKATVCVIGPGLGLDTWAIQLFNYALASQLPMVIDASALRILAQKPQYDDNWVLTPHPGEAAGLLGITTEEVQNDRLQSVIKIQQKYGGNVVLKGAGSLVYTDEQQTWLCDAGNPGMATAGMGDLLSGVIGALIAQGVPLAKAASAGVWLHSRAADLSAIEDGERGMIATDLLPFIRYLMNTH